RRRTVFLSSPPHERQKNTEVLSCMQADKNNKSGKAKTLKERQNNQNSDTNFLFRQERFTGDKF
ncbi:MAG: hypothetical protein IKB16_14685, partial [Lentisphaeria bacterium]|nr:hypothetical protein [Lentisphaeria bacterium]